METRPRGQRTCLHSFLHSASPAPSTHSGHISKGPLRCRSCTKTIQMSVSLELPEQLTSGLDLQEKETIWFPPRLVAPQESRVLVNSHPAGTLPGPCRDPWGKMPSSSGSMVYLVGDPRKHCQRAGTGLREANEASSAGHS